MMRSYLQLAILFLVIHWGNSFGQTYSYQNAGGNLKVDVILSHPCDVGATNGTIQFKVNAAGGGAARLVFVSSQNGGILDVLNQSIPVGSTFTYTPTAPQNDIYDFSIFNTSGGGGSINTAAMGPVELVLLPDITLSAALTNNSNCGTPNGQVVASLSGGSKSPALPVAGSFAYSWTTSNGLAGFPVNGTFDGTGTLDLVALRGMGGLPAGTYTLTVDDGYSVCGATQGFTITDPSPLTFNTTTSTPNVCLGSGGSVQLSNSEGSAVNYEIYLNGNPTGINQNGNNGALSFAIPSATINAVGAYNLTIRAVNGLCTPAFMNGTAVITVLAPPTTSNAGSNQNICATGTATLAANSPTIGTGAWSVSSGPSMLLSQFSNASSPTATFTPAGGAGNYVLTWTISNAPCTPSTSNVTIAVTAAPTTSNAGSNQNICATGTATLAANSPTIGTGAWSVSSGPSMLLSQFSNASSPTATFTPAGGAGNYVLTWTISNAPCTPSTSNVTIAVTAAPTTSNAGSNQNICATGTATLAANSPTVGTGAWSVSSGPSTLLSQFSNASSPTATFTPAGGAGNYVLVWTISNAPCTPSTSNVTIAVTAAPTTSAAGSDQNLCGVTSTTLAANTPTIGTGAWTIVSGTGGSFGNAASATSSFNGTSGSTYQLRWTISSAPCTASTDDVIVTFNQNPTTANAGPDQLNLCGVTSATLAANTPTVGTGAWGIVSGFGGSFGNALSPTSSFSGTAGSTYVLSWTITNGPCTSTANVTIVFNQNPTTANAGSNQNICSTGTATLAANSPTIGTGAWSVSSGPSALLSQFSNASSPTATFTPAGGAGNYVLVWTISNAPCTPSTSNVTITVTAAPTTSNAGSNQNICSASTATLAANSPTIGTGAWSVSSGPSTLLSQFSNASSPTATFTPAGGAGNYVLVWTISNAPCTPSTSNVTIAVTAAPTTSVAGSNQNICSTSTATLAANSPTMGTGAWSVSSGPSTLLSQFSNASSPTATFTPAGGAGNYVLVWTISNAPCTPSTSNVTIAVTAAPTTSVAGSNQNICSISTATLAANAPTIGTGAWSIASGPSTLLSQFSSASNPAATFTPAGGAGNYVLTWTISNAPCVPSTSNVTISVTTPPTVSAAGSNQNICETSTATLAANIPTSGAGVWSVSSGPSTLASQFSNANSATATFTPAGGAGNYVLTWTISNSPCAPSASNVTIAVFGAPTTANAGLDQLSLCGVTSTTLAGNTPIVGTGSWSIVSGTGGSFGTSGNPTSSFSGAMGSTYVLRWTIANAPCTSSTDDVTIKFNQNPSFTFAKSNVTGCVPGNDGSITVTASGGIGTYQYSNDGGTSFQASNIFNGLVAGNYDVIVQDGIGCQSTITTVTITSPAGLSATTSSVDVTCHGGSNGSITITAIGGSGSYTYSKDNGVTFQASNVFSGLTAATYDIVVLDGGGCQFTTSVTINEPTVVAFTSASTNITCNGANDGSITITPSGGSGTYTYSKDGGTSFQGSNVFNALASGPYSIQIKDSNGCISTVSVVTITEPLAVSFTTSISNATTCVPGNDGSISINASGGTGAYQYSNNNGASFQPSNSFAGLTAGSYTIIVRDANLCQSAPSVVAVGTPSAVSFTAVVTDATCNGAGDGSIAITASGGNGVYSYSVNNGTSFQPSANFNGLAVGTYQTFVRDGNNCLSPTSNLVINQPSGVTFLATKVDATSCGSSDGQLDVLPSGGTGPYAVSIDNGVVFTGPGLSFNYPALPAGAYTIIASDANNCMSAPSVVNILSPGSLSFSSVNQNVTCFGGNNGSITITASGGSGIFTYSKDNGATFQASNVFNGLTAGTYPIVVSDGSGCQFVGNVNITQPSTINTAVFFNNLTCNGSGDGSISVVASGGTGALQYSINNGTTYQASANFNGLSAGNYNVIVRDASSCVSSVTPVILTEPTAVTFISTKVDPSLCGSNDGSITVTPSGGDGSYFVSIDNGANFTGPGTSFTFPNLTAGSYNVIAHDGANCQTSVSNITLNSAGGITATFSKTDVTCFGGSNGTITLAGSGGTGVYTYSIDNGATFQGSGSFSGLAAATYPVVARDGLGCTFSGSLTLNQTAAVTFTTSQVDVACNGGGTGSITVSASGGNNLFSYSKDNGVSFQASNIFNGLAAGSYPIAVKDGNNCMSSVSSVSITEPAALSFTTSKSDASTCTPGNEGIITVNPSGGSGSYQYSKDGGTTFQGTNIFNGLTAGNYDIVVKDGNSCVTAPTTITIAAPTPPDATFSGLAPSYCTTNANVTLTPMVVGGTFSGTGVTGNSFSPSTAGAGTFNIQYTITVSGCTSTTSQSVTVTTSTVDASFSGLNFVYCANATAATLTPTTVGGTFSGPGISGSTFDPAVAGAGQHTIQYTVTSGGCTGTTSKIVTVLLATDPLCTGSVGTGTCASVIITPKPSPATCTNSDGKIVFSIKPFIPLVNNTGVKISIKGVSITNLSISRTNFNDSTFLALPVGTYDYSIEYGDPSCIKIGQVTIDQSGTIGTPVASNIVNPTCAGSRTGSVIIDVPGETGNTLEWSIGELDINGTVIWTPFICGTAITGLPQGTAPSFQHLISVRRNSSDPCNGGVIITMQDVAPAITIPSTVTNASCSNDDGSIQIGTISGGVAPYSYSFDGVAMAALPVANTFTNLAAGNHDFTVIDANACSQTQTIAVGFPGIISITPTVLNPDCSGNGLNGAITVTVNSVGNFDIGISTDVNTPPASFVNVTSGGAATVPFTNLSKGAYFITAQSTASLCSITQTVNISSGPYSVDFTSTANDIACFSDMGVLHLDAITGDPTLAYGYEILTGGNVVKSGAITALEALGPVDIQGINQGVFQVRLFQNQAACVSPVYSSYKSFTITGPMAALDTISVVRTISFPDQPTGSMNIVVQESGREPYEFKLELTDPLFDEQSMPAIDWTQMSRSSQTLKIEQEVSKASGFNDLYAGLYTLYLRDAFSCEKVFLVTIGLNTELFIPNIFTPNGDDANEEFYIRNLPPSSKVVITDRWGKEIYSSNNYQNNWRGGNSPDGIYYYKVLVGSDTFSGWVEILRGQ